VKGEKRNSLFTHRFAGKKNGERSFRANQKFLAKQKIRAETAK
jgi:hypothetical protein